MLRHNRAASLLRGITSFGCVLSLTACASSASLVRKGRFAEACRKIAADSREHQQVFREQVFARLAPRLSLEAVDANTSSELRGLVSNRFAAPRFVRITFSHDPSAPFEARMALEKVRDRRASYIAGDPADAYFAADLVTPKPEKVVKTKPKEVVKTKLEEDLGNLLDLGKLLIGGSLLLTSVAVCSVAGAPPDCLGSPFSSPTDERQRRLAAVDADPELRSPKNQLVELGKSEPGLTILFPNSDSPAKKAVTLYIALHTQFGREATSCLHRQEVLVELPGDTYEEAIANERSGHPQPLEALHPRLE